MERIVGEIRRIARAHFDKARLSHDWEHTERVCRLAVHIGSVEGACLDTVTIAAVLHDIGRIQQDAARGAVCHARIGAEMARDILAAFDIPLAVKENICHCILTHRFRNSHVPETLEAKCLFDADKLDAIGAVGIARAYLFAGELGALLHNSEVPPEKAEPYSADDTGYREYWVKLRTIKDRMLTAEGKRLAEGRHAFMEAFFERFLKEIEGII